MKVLQFTGFCLKMDKLNGKMKITEKVFSETERMLYLYPDYLKSNRTAEVNFSENAVKILRLQAGGITICEIARLLCISKNTVKYHTEETYKNLG